MLPIPHNKKAPAVRCSGRRVLVTGYRTIPPQEQEKEKDRTNVLYRIFAPQGKNLS